MAGRSRYQLWNGRGVAPPRRPVLRAGPVTCILDGADLRHVRVGDVELVQRVYVAVRDAPWNTIPAELSELSIEQSGAAFLVAFKARHQYEDIDFAWRGTIRGTPDGQISYEMDGLCAGVFKYSKIGLNVHHGLAESVGHAYRAETPDGEIRGLLPKEIEPQRIEGGTLTGMFAPYRQLSIRVAEATEARISLEGDLLELQDHRNWTDANFKSYATPLALGFPFDSTPGQRIRQALTIRHEGHVSSATPHRPAELRVGRSAGARMPALGLGMPSHGGQLTPRERSLLRTLCVDHLRVDLVLSEPASAAAFDAAAAAARELDSRLELALFTNTSGAPALSQLAERIRAGSVGVARVLVYPASDGFSAFVTTTPAALVALVRQHLEPVTGQVVFAGGTNQNFSDVNRDRPSDPVLNGVCFSVSPTVHAADDASIVENLAGQSEVIETCRQLFGDRALVVSPVTLATRFGPYPAGPAKPGDLPPAVDVRQASLLGAAWSVGSIQRFAESGTSSVTYYETTGWRGVIERDSGSPMPERFPSGAGDVFPMYHVFADVADWKAGAVRGVELSDPLRAVGFAVELDGQMHLLAANVTPGPQDIEISGLAESLARVRVLDDASCADAMTDAPGFRARPGGQRVVREGRLVLQLEPYAVARIDLG